MSERLSIGEFARRAGLSVSAVRFYGDRGLLVPASVDPASGYRAYDADQVVVGRTIGALRRLRMPLADVATYLSSAPGDRATLVDRQVQTLETHLDDARAVARTLDDAQRRSEPPVPSVTLPSAAFAAALDQVLPAASRDPEHPVLTCVLIEARDGSLRLVATDRYRLAVRDLVPDAGRDQVFRGLVPAPTLRRWRTDLPTEGSLTVVASTRELAIRGERIDLRTDLVRAEFPEYEAVLARDVPGRAVVVDRAALHDGLARFTSQDAVLVRAGVDGVTLVGGDEELTVPASGDGPAEVALDPTYAAEAVGAVSGPDVVVELTDAVRPVVVRSADDGTFTTLLMPVRIA